MKEAINVDLVNREKLIHFQGYSLVDALDKIFTSFLSESISIHSSSIIPA